MHGEGWLYQLPTTAAKAMALVVWVALKTMVIAKMKAGVDAPFEPAISKRFHVCLLLHLDRGLATEYHCLLGYKDE